MSTVLLLLCHPNPRSFNHAVAESVASALNEAGQTVLFHDLYEEKFDPVLSSGELRRRFSFEDLVQRHYRDLESAEGVLIVHPEWWSTPPAMLKGWVDRVLGPGIGYEYEGEEFMPKNKVPLLTGKRALVLATTDSEEPAQHLGATQSARAADESLTPVSQEGVTDGGNESIEEPAKLPLLGEFWRETFRYCGIETFRFRMVYGMRDIDPADRREWLIAVAELARDFFA